MRKLKQGRQRKRLKAFKENVDRISSLPDCLLLHIMSFLKMDDVMRTTLLSKRWRYLWKFATCLDYDFQNWRSDMFALGEASLEIDRKLMVTFIDRSLIGHEGPKIQAFCVPNLFDKDCCSQVQVDSWIQFAVRHNVENLTLQFSTKCAFDYRPNPPYQLPHTIYNCKSLKVLYLSFCDLSLPALIHLPSLKQLTLSVLYISTDAIKRLTSSCPVLEELVLDGCNADDNVDIVIENPNIRSLEIYGHCITLEVKPEIMIFAPYLVSLTLCVNMVRDTYSLESLHSLLKATINHHNYPRIDCEQYDDVWARLLGDLYHVKELNLSSSFIQGLSASQLQHSDSFAIPINATRIQLDSDFTKWELMGISCLLRNSSKLEDLTIRPGNKKARLSSNFKDKFHIEERGFWESLEFDFLSAMQNLKTVHICLCSGTYAQRRKLEFVEFVLKNSKALERITLTIDPLCNNHELLYMFTEKLKFFPRASSNAEIRTI